MDKIYLNNILSSPYVNEQDSEDILRQYRKKTNYFGPEVKSEQSEDDANKQAFDMLVGMELLTQAIKSDDLHDKWIDPAPGEIGRSMPTAYGTGEMDNIDEPDNIKETNSSGDKTETIQINPKITKLGYQVIKSTVNDNFIYKLWSKYNKFPGRGERGSTTKGISPSKPAGTDPEDIEKKTEATTFTLYIGIALIQVPSGKTFKEMYIWNNNKHENTIILKSQNVETQEIKTYDMFVLFDDQVNAKLLGGLDKFDINLAINQASKFKPKYAMHTSMSKVNDEIKLEIANESKKFARALYSVTRRKGTEFKARTPNLNPDNVSKIEVLQDEENPGSIVIYDMSGSKDRVLSAKEINSFLHADNKTFVDKWVNRLEREGYFEQNPSMKPTELREPHQQSEVPKIIQKVEPPTSKTKPALKLKPREIPTKTPSSSVGSLPSGPTKPDPSATTSSTSSAPTTSTKPVEPEKIPAKKISKPPETKVEPQKTGEGDVGRAYRTKNGTTYWEFNGRKYRVDAKSEFDKKHPDLASVLNKALKNANLINEHLQKPKKIYGGKLINPFQSANFLL